MNDYRLYIFLGFLTLFIFLEYFFPFHPRVELRSKRWRVNLSIIVIASVIGRLLFPLTLVEMAILVEKKGLGLLNQVQGFENIKIILGIILLDFFIYLQHVASHRFNFLWRIHRVHHADVDLDTTTALRFHPVEIILSLIYKGILITLFGFSANTVLAFEIILNLTAMFNHSNIHIPPSLEKVLRKIIVTPQMHIVHHSGKRKEHDNNYGFNLSIWDSLFGTYKKFSDGSVGLSQFKNLSLLESLKLPFFK